MVFETYAVLHVFCLYFYYTMCTHHHLGNWYRHLLELRERGRFMNYIFFKKRPCRMLCKLLTGLREVFGRPLLHGRSIPPTSWTKLILRKLYSENGSAADHLIHFIFFYNACPSFTYCHGKQRQTRAETFFLILGTKAFFSI